jgi:hypothetical protein
MTRFGVNTNLSPAQTIERAVDYFGAEGLGLELSEQSECCATFVGGGGHVQITATGQAPETSIELVTQEWDYDVKQFMRKIA